MVDLLNEEIRQMTSFKTPRIRHTSVILNNQLYIIGGVIGIREFTNSVEAMQDNQWIDKAPINQAR